MLDVLSANQEQHMTRTITLNGYTLTDILVDGRWLTIKVEPA